MKAAFGEACGVAGLAQAARKRGGLFALGWVGLITCGNPGLLEFGHWEAGVDLKYDNVRTRYESLISDKGSKGVFRVDFAATPFLVSKLRARGIFQHRQHLSPRKLL